MSSVWYRPGHLWCVKLLSKQMEFADSYTRPFALFDSIIHDDCPMPHALYWLCVCHCVYCGDSYPNIWAPVSVNLLIRFCLISYCVVLMLTLSVLMPLLLLVLFWSFVCLLRSRLLQFNHIPFSLLFPPFSDVFNYHPAFTTIKIITFTIYMHRLPSFVRSFARSFVR